MPVFIGDVHGRYDKYKAIIREYPNTIQVGDMGVGFRRWPHGELSTDNPPHAEMVKANAQFIRGNHDNPAECRRHSQYIPDGKVHNDMMFIGGGYSVDWRARMEDFSWWKDEQLSQAEMNTIIDIYISAKPRLMVTHECPTTAALAIPHSHHWDDRSRTEQFLQALWEIHKPKIWVHGHHHISVDHVINGTRFVCLAELEVKDIKIV